MGILERVGEAICNVDGHQWALKANPLIWVRAFGTEERRRRCPQCGRLEMLMRYGTIYDYDYDTDHTEEWQKVSTKRWKQFWPPPNENCANRRWYYRVWLQLLSWMLTGGVVAATANLVFNPPSPFRLLPWLLVYGLPIALCLVVQFRWHESVAGGPAKGRSAFPAMWVPIFVWWGHLTTRG